MKLSMRCRTCSQDIFYPPDQAPSVCPHCLSNPYAYPGTNYGPSSGNAISGALGLIWYGFLLFLGFCAFMFVVDVFGGVFAWIWSVISWFSWWFWLGLFLLVCYFTGRD